MCCRLAPPPPHGMTRLATEKQLAALPAPPTPAAPSLLVPARFFSDCRGATSEGCSTEGPQAKEPLDKACSSRTGPWRRRAAGQGNRLKGQCWFLSSKGAAEDAHKRQLHYCSPKPVWRRPLGIEKCGRTSRLQLGSDDPDSCGHATFRVIDDSFFFAEIILRVGPDNVQPRRFRAKRGWWAIAGHL